MCAAVALIAAILGAGPTAASGASVSATDVCGAQNGRAADRLVLRIQFHADPNSHPALTNAEVARFAKALAVTAETLFNGHGYTVAGTPVLLEVNTSIRTADAPPAPDTHQIAVTASSDARSGIVGVGSPGGAPVQGELSLGYIGSRPLVGLHELGHLLGLHDQYHDVLEDAFANQAPVPPGMVLNNDGSIQNKADFVSYATAHHLDLATMKGVSVPNPKHAHDIMATTKDPDAGFQPEALRSLVAAAHHCDPPAPKYRVPLFPGGGGRGCSSAKTFHPILDTPWPAVALDRYRRAFKPPVECDWNRELAAERALVDYALELASTAGEIRTSAGNTCDVTEATALYKIFDQLYNNARNAAGEVATRSMAVLWAIVHRRSGFVLGVRGVRVIRLFSDNVFRTTRIDSLIGGTDQLECTEGPAGASSSGPFA